MFVVSGHIKPLHDRLSAELTILPHKPGAGTPAEIYGDSCAVPPGHDKNFYKDKFLC
jgi:hypothetical protein